MKKHCNHSEEPGERGSRFGGEGRDPRHGGSRHDFWQAIRAAAGRAKGRFEEGAPQGEFCGPQAFGGPEGFGGPGGFGGRGGFGGPGGFGPGGPRGFGRMHGWGERGRRRREFEAAELRLLLLQLIAEQPRHGYDLIRELESRSGGAYAPSPGVVYPTLTMLQDMGYIAESPAEGARKNYAITPEGTAHLEANKAQAETLASRIADMGSEQQRSENSSVRRATENLHRALLLRFAGNRGDAHDPELSHRVAALLDEVTQKIERS